MGDFSPREDLRNSSEPRANKLPECESGNLPDVQLLPFAPNADDLLSGCDLGPTKLMSPTKIFQICGNSSSAVRRNSRPTRVILGSFRLACISTRAGLLNIERNFRASKEPPVTSDPILSKKDRPAILQPNTNPDQGPHRKNQIHRPILERKRSNTRLKTGSRKSATTNLTGYPRPLDSFSAICISSVRLFRLGCDTPPLRTTDSPKLQDLTVPNPGAPIPPAP